MIVTLKRYELGDDYTLGVMSIDGLFLGYTLEDKDRNLESGGEKVYGKTAIPRGRYELVMSFSNRFQRVMPEILSVPQFDGVRIHGGNTVEQTLGCPLLGAEVGGNKVCDCAGVNETLRRRLIQAGQRNERSWIEVS